MVLFIVKEIFIRKCRNCKCANRAPTLQYVHLHEPAVLIETESYIDGMLTGQLDHPVVLLYTVVLPCLRIR